MPQLRCLVVLPTRDLAAQVFKVFSGLCPAVGLRAGLAAAQASVAAEAADLFGNGQEPSPSGMIQGPCYGIRCIHPAVWALELYLNPY